MTSLSNKIVRRARRMVRSVTHPSFLPIASYLIANPAGSSATPAAPDAIDHPPISPEFTTEAVASRPDIPQNIFQTWKSRSVIPGNYRGWRTSFLAINPGYRLILWDDDDNRAFVAARFPWFLPIYDRYPKEIYRADAVRPLFLFLIGGFYADMDSECLRPLEPLRDRADVLLGRMGWDNGFEHAVPNALMASRPFQIFWLLYVAIMMEKAAGASVEAMALAGPETFTGPIALKEAADFYRTQPDAVLDRCKPVIDALPPEWRAQIESGTLALLEPDAWYGIDWTNPMHRRLRAKILKTQRPLDRTVALRLFPKATLITYWSHSW